jgi:ElaB/YqjD/DUF883 family membrane-anchored ribosome-binding protein
MKNNKHTAQSPKDILDELHSLVADAEKLVGDATESSEEAVSSLRSRYEAAQERLADVYDTTKQRVIAGAKYTDVAIRENPYQSVAIAAGVGVLIGVLLGRRTR